MSETETIQELIHSEKNEFDKWGIDLKYLLKNSLYKKEELFIISQYWFNKYIKYILDSDNNDKKLLENSVNLKDDNNELFCQFTEEIINIEDLPRVFVLNKNIWNNIQKHNKQLNIIGAFGYFYNNLLFLKVLENIYCFFFIDSKNKIRQGYLQTNQVKIEDNLIKDFQEKGIIEFIKNNIKDLGDEKLKNSKDNEYNIYILNSIFQKDNDNNKNENDFESKIIKRKSSKKLSQSVILKDIKEDEINYILGGKIFNIKKYINLDLKKILGPIQFIKNLKNLIESKNEEKKQDDSENNTIYFSINANEIQNETEKDLGQPKFFKNFFPKIEKKIPIPGIIGLQNIGATCYMNATLQCFSNIKRLRNNLLDKKKYEFLEKNKNKYKLSFALAEVIKNLWQNLEINYYAPQYFKDIISEMNPLFRGIAANDPKDLVLENIHKELNFAQKNNVNFFANNMNFNLVFNEFIHNFNSQNQSIISREFYGCTNSMTVCSFCRVAIHNVQAYNILFFPLEEVRKFMNYQYNIVKIEDCFRYYEKQEIYPSK